MSFILRSTRFAARTSTTYSPLTRSFTTTPFRALKEGTQNTNEEGQAEFNEKHKQDQLQKQKEGKGHWKPELASQSEEDIAADRSSSNDSIEEMQKKTATYAEEKQK